MKKLLGMFLSLLLTSMPIIAAQEVDKSKMSQAHQKAYDAALALYGTSGDVTHFLCSTTIIAHRASTNGASGKYEYLLLTAGHCITGDGLPTDLIFGVSEKIIPETESAKLQHVDVVKAENDDKYDFALLYLNSNKEYPVIDIDFDNVPKIEDKIYNVNYSLGLVKQVSLGSVASEVMKVPSANDECTPCVGRYMVHVFDGPGSSGSAIIDEKTNKIVGILELGFPGQTMGVAAETMKAFKEWLDTPQVSKISPNAQSRQSKVTWN